MPGKTPLREDVKIETAIVSLEGTLTLPPTPRGLVIFAHGSGSSRLSPRNRFVGEVLQGRELGTLLFDLLTPDEHELDRVTRHLRFDINLLAERLTGALDWVRRQPQCAGLRLGLFGSSTGAAAALVTASRRPHELAALVSRGGRPDLAGDALRQVKAPTLLIIGGEDSSVLEINQAASVLIPGIINLEVIPGATHLFEEPGALEQMSRLARDWFSRHLAQPPEQGASPTR